jgi:hypothetical protein
MLQFSELEANMTETPKEGKVKELAAKPLVNTNGSIVSMENHIFTPEEAPDTIEVSPDLKYKEGHKMENQGMAYVFRVGKFVKDMIVS